MTRQLVALAVVLLIAIQLIGCGDSPDARLHDLARASLAQQARQNEEMARQAQQFAQSVHRLVQADSQARQELLAAHAKLQQDLQAERVSIERQLQSAEIVQALVRQITVGKQNRTFVVILSPVVQLPVELEKLFVVLEHELPSRAQLHEIARGIATEEGELPSGPEVETVLDAACGLTRYEAEGAFSLAIARDGQLTPGALWELKAGMLKKSGLLQLHRGGEDFSSLGGLQALKAFCKRSLLQPARHDPLKRPRGGVVAEPPILPLRLHRAPAPLRLGAR